MYLGTDSDFEIAEWQHLVKDRLATSPYKVVITQGGCLSFVVALLWWQTYGGV